MIIKCSCGSTVFHVHAPPPKTPMPLRKVYLVCEKCQKLWRLQDAELPDVDEQGVLKSEGEVSGITEERVTKLKIEVTG